MTPTAVLVASLALTAGPPPAAAVPDPAALSATVRGLLLQNLPDPLVQSAPGWGKQKVVTVGVKFHRDGPRLWSEPQKAPRNDGVWRRVSARAADAEQTLKVGLHDVRAPEPGRLTFDAYIGLDCHLKLEQQVWRAGARLYSGETRGRCRTAVLLRCEATNRTEAKPGSLLPEVVFRVRVTEAQLFYEGLVIEHTAGVGGDAAKLLGETAVNLVKRLKPDLERELLNKANAAIVKAADTKEVRVELDKLLSGRPAVTRTK